MVPSRSLRKRIVQMGAEEDKPTSSVQVAKRLRADSENSANGSSNSATRCQTSGKKSKIIKNTETLIESNSFINICSVDSTVPQISNGLVKKNDKKINCMSSASGKNEIKNVLASNPEEKSNTTRSINLQNSYIDTLKRKPVSSNSQCFIHQLNNLCMGRKNNVQTVEPLHGPVLNHLSKLTVFKAVSPFDRRTTSLAWHPTEPSTIAAGSKGGDIMLWNFDSSKDSYIQGIGAGGSILAMKFHSEKPTQLYTAALDGKICLQDFQGKHTKVLLDTANRNQWFCSLDVASDEKLIVCGDSLGNVTLMSPEQEKIWSLKLHRNKVSHAEFCSKDKWLLATSSIDKTLKLWDIRHVKNKDGALYVCHHDKPINSAYFDLQTGTKILTTDQNNQIRIYSSPFWELERIIYHPHRHFQHLTPIKAHWSPLSDIITIGRYPDENFPDYSPGERRTIDFFDANTGNLLYQITEQGVVGILSLNQFNKTGEVLASCMGYNILIWKDREEVEHKRSLGRNHPRILNTNNKNHCNLSPHQPPVNNSNTEPNSNIRRNQFFVKKTNV